jgi:hypothetical protein
VLGETKKDYPVKFESQKWLWHYCVLQKKRWRRAILCGDEMLNVTLSEIVDSVSDIWDRLPVCLNVIHKRQTNIFYPTGRQSFIVYNCVGLRNWNCSWYYANFVPNLRSTIVDGVYFPISLSLSLSLSVTYSSKNNLKYFKSNLKRPLSLSVLKLMNLGLHIHKVTFR